MTRDGDSYNDCLLYNIRRTIDNLKAKGELANKSCAEIYDIASAGFMPIPSLKSFDEGAMLAPDGTLLLTSPDNDSYAIKFHYSDGITARLRKWHEAAMAKRQSQSVEKEKPNQNCPLVESTPKQSEQPSISKVEKGITMSENRTVQTPFGFDLSFTQAGPNLVMGTMIGIAIRSAADAPWRIYDRDKHEIVDLGNLQMGNLPVWEGPAFKVKSGDVIKHDDTYYYCESREGQHLTAIEIATSKKQEIIIPKNILGMNIYRKLYGFTNLLGEAAELSDDKLFIMMAMQNGGGMQNSLLPLMLLKGGDFDDDKLLMMMAMSNMGGGQDTNNGLVQLLLMKGLLHAPNTPDINNINIDVE